MNQLTNVLMLLLMGLPTMGFAQIGIRAGSGIGVGWMIYHNGLSTDGLNQSLGYDRTYVSLLFPVEAEILWKSGRLELGAGAMRTIMYDDFMIGTTDRRGDKNRYRVAPADQNLLYEGVWLSGAWILNPTNRIHISPGLRIGTFRSNTIHPAWNLLGTAWLFTPKVDVSWELFDNFSCWISPQYIHLWRNDGVGSRVDENLHLHAIDIRAGFLFWLGDADAQARKTTSY